MQKRKSSHQQGRPPSPNNESQPLLPNHHFPSASSSSSSSSSATHDPTSAVYDPKDKKTKHSKTKCFYLTLVMALAVLSFGILAYMDYSGQLEFLRRPRYYLIENANVYTVDDKLPHATAFVVKHGYIVDVGTDASKLHFLHPNAKRINVNNATIVPGLIDSHAHLLNLGRSLLEVDVTGSLSTEQVRSILKQRLSSHPPCSDVAKLSGWVKGRGWDQNKWKGGKFPTTKDLDADPALAKVPIVLTRIDGHALWANAKAVELARKNFPKEWEMEGGEIVLDDQGNPTGVFIDDAMKIFSDTIPEESEEESMNALKTATSHMLEYGLTGLHDAGVSLADIELFKKAIDRNQFPIRNYAMIYCSDACKNLPPKLIPYDVRHHLTVQSVKFVSDGALGSWGAAMIEPYSDEPDKKGLLRISSENLQSWTWEVMSQGYQVNVHCIGDLANKITLDAFERNHARWDAIHGTNESRSIRNRIEHSQIMRLEDIPRFGKLGVIPSVQPTHATSDMSYVEKRLGIRAKGAYIWRTFLEDLPGVPHLPLGSDFPIEHVDPMKGIYSAVTRKWPDGNSPANTTDGWFPKEKLSRQQALKGFTLSAAYAAHQEDILGSITKGKLADFVVYDKNWLSEKDVSDQELLQIKPKTVVLGGFARFGRLRVGVRQ
ncbi:hypothetical protein HDU97_003820 [Phlyctochytrium planicorne]|nr:hypothetical protein HDU97_003820 [Phlyctochytrium planicorne]